MAKSNIANRTSACGPFRKALTTVWVVVLQALQHLWAVLLVGLGSLILLRNISLKSEWGHIK